MCELNITIAQRDITHRAHRLLADEWSEMTNANDTMLNVGLALHSAGVGAIDPPFVPHSNNTIVDLTN